MAKRKTKKELHNIKIRNFLEKNGYEKYTNIVISTKDWVIVVVSALLLATFFKTFFYENFKIPSGSMNPLLLNGDRVLVNKFYYGYTKFSFPFDFPPISGRILSNRSPKRGDIVVFKLPSQENKSIYYIKRVIGLPGDKIKLKDGLLHINGKVLQYKKGAFLEAQSEYNHNPFGSVVFEETNFLNRKYNILISDKDSIAGNTSTYEVPEGHYFCMGDNRDNSKDSRFYDFGFIPFKNIVGRAERIFFSTANGTFNLSRIFKNIQAEYTE